LSTTTDQRRLLALELKVAKAMFKQLDIIQLPDEVILLQRLLLSTEFPDIEDVVHLISKNETLAGDVVELANKLQPKEGLLVPVTSIREAINRLGMERLKNLVLSISMTQGMKALSLEQLQQHSIDVAQICAHLSAFVDIDQEEAYLIGLFHNVGALLMMSKFSEYESLFFKSLSAPFSAYRMEERQFHTTHAFIGVLLADKWQLNANLKKVMLQHHQPLHHLTGSSVIDLVAMVQLADALVIESTYGEYLSDEVKLMRKQAQAHLMVPEENLHDLRIALLTNQLTASTE